MRRHMFVPDAQTRPGVPTRHLTALSNAIREYLPDVIDVIGDWWDLPSLSKHELPGSKQMEGKRVKEDIDFGNECWKLAFGVLDSIVGKRFRRHDGTRPRYRPELHFHFGNHEHRLTRAVGAEPKWEGMLTLDALKTPGFQRHDFLKMVEIDGVTYSHYFSNTLSGRAIGGSISNRLNKIGKSFVQGHQQGILFGQQQYPGNLIRHGLVAGSFYLHDEHYRDVQSNGEWRGIVILNEVHDGHYDIMPLSMEYLLRRFGE
jgi:hypothetical protein